MLELSSDAPDPPAVGTASHATARDGGNGFMLKELDEAKSEAKSDLLGRAASAAEQGHPPPGLRAGTLADFLTRYYRHVPPEELIGRDPHDVYGAAVSHLALAAHRPPGRPSVRVYSPTVQEHGWSSGHTVVEVVTDDMPFLVDSVNGALTRHNRPIHGVIHPQLAVRRTLTGELVEICPASDPAHAPADAIVESWIHLEIDRESNKAVLETIQRQLEEVLGHVREVVEDWPRMRATALRIAESLSTGPVPVEPTEAAEAQELLRWLVDEHFTFLGYREYDLRTEDGVDVLRTVPGTGLGISRPDKLVSASFAQASAESRAKFRERRLLTLSKAMDKSTVHKPTYLDYVGVKKFDPAGAVVGERRFLGLLSSAAYAERVTRIPVIRRKVAAVFAEAGLDPSSHDGRDLMEILETYPREELFQISVPDLAVIAQSVLRLAERSRLRLYLRRDELGRFLSALVYLPRDRVNTQVRLRMQDILLAQLGGATIDYTLRSTESALARLHFVVRMAPGQELPKRIDDVRIEELLVEATRQWEDDFADALAAQCGEEQAGALRERYAAAIPAAYRADFPARIAVADLRQIDALPQLGGLATNLYQPLGGGAPGRRRFKIYRLGESLSLSALLPVLSRMGVEVVDERPYEFAPAGGPTAWVYDLGLRFDPALEDGLEAARPLFQDAFAAVCRGTADNDGFNRLVLAAGLTWRQAMLLRAYAKYLRQVGTAFSQDYIEQCLGTNARIARLLVELFEARLDPADQRAGDRAAAADRLVEQVTAELEQVASLDADRILRSLLRLVQATLRTNYFQPGTGGATADGTAKPYVSFKLNPEAIPELPAPRPRYEVWVYSPRVEGVHLRFGTVARGGLRWSDRREDFRTEVLGLVKAQMVKNAVIVPVGAKGGFVVKSPPDPADREAGLAEGVACYTTFVRGLLDLTDNLVVRDGRRVVQPPPETVRHDPDDSYLVVAADKGTATFSDIANRVAAEYGYWLGDAFASGGSTGYDHKAMGITARGAWESVKRHFRELGIDVQTQDVTCVGIGDMSGDVFGNGMLLSPHIRLVAAFDHRHIFLDPDPDPAVSFVERRRLYELPRSSWADYDRALISAGGGVYPRTAKSVPVSPQVADRLGLPGGPGRLTPAELLRAILTAPVDLLWNGGIGTYVKAGSEANTEVGDKSNDAIRVNGAQVRARVVGEGGNLGCTQLGRIEYALAGGPRVPAAGGARPPGIDDLAPLGAGGRVNTDAIDNSAGVDCSDHEVNIKILLDSVVAAGDLTTGQRNELLAAMTSEVAELVLRDNYDQNVALATAMMQAPSLLDVHSRFIRRLEREGRLDRRIEFLPTDKQIAERRQAGLGLTQPELAVLLAYTKITMYEELISSELPEDPFLRGTLYRYFPTAVRERFRDQIDRHPLRREIIATGVVNQHVNSTGITSLFRLREETGASAPDVARAHTLTTEVYDAAAVWAAVEDLDNAVPAEVLTRIRLESRKLTERATRWFLYNRRSPLDIEAQVRLLRAGVAEVVAHLPKLVRGIDLRRMEAIRDDLAASGVPDRLAEWVAAMPTAFAALDICEVARGSGREVIEVAGVYFDLADRVQLATLLDRILALPRSDRWKSLARAALRDDLYRAHAGLTSDVLACGGPGSTPEERFATWVERNRTVLDRTRQTMADIESTETWDLATLSVSLRLINGLLRHSNLA
jgi:glutamate dehydrogenase